MRHCARSNAIDSSVITSVVASVIQNTIAIVGALMRVRRSCCVPSAHTAAAISMPHAAHGLPDIAPSSCHSSSATPIAAAATPAHWRALRRWPNNAMPTIAEKIGIV